MNEITTKKPIYKKWWFIAGAAIIIIGAIAGGSKSGEKLEKSATEVSSNETEAEISETSITGTWYNSGEYGENKLQILNPDNFIYTNPLGEKLFGKWTQVYGNTYNLMYNDGTEGEATLNGEILDYVGADWKKN